jgi:sugar phosphate permease
LAPASRRETALSPILVRKMLSYRWFIFGLLSFAYMLVVFHRMSTAVITSDLVETFLISPVSLGVLGSMYFYPYSLMQIPAGMMADSIGPRKLVASSLLIAGGGAILFGLAPTFPVAVFGRFLIGVGLSAVFVPTLKILSIWFRQNEFATLTGILNSVGSLGSLVATVPLAFIVLSIGWRQTMFIIGGLTVVVAAAVYILVRNRPRDKGYPSIEEIDGVPAASRPAEPQVPVFQGLRAVLSNRYAWPLFFRGFISSGGWTGLQTMWGIPYLMQVVGLDRIAASSLMAMISIGTIVSAPIGGFISDRVLRSRRKPVLLAAVLSNLLWVPLAFFSDRLTPSMLMVIFLMMGLVGGLGVAGFAMIKELFPPALTGTVNGTNNFFGMFGGAVYQVFLGAIIGRYVNPATPDIYPPEAFRAAFMFLFFNITAGTVATFFTKETMPSRPTEQKVTGTA